MRRSMNRSRILSLGKAVTGVAWASKAHSTPIPPLCDGRVTLLKWTLRWQLIYVTPIESAKIACYTPTKRLQFLTGYSCVTDFSQTKVKNLFCILYIHQIIICKLWLRSHICPIQSTGTSQTSLGAVWYFFKQILKYIYIYMYSISHLRSNVRIY